MGLLIVDPAQGKGELDFFTLYYIILRFDGTHR